MIGLSLSKCVAAICRGEVKRESVEKIIARTTVPNEYAWDQVFTEYVRTIWKDFPEQAVKIAEDFIGRKLVEQSILTRRGKRPDISGGIWVRSEKEIKWDQLSWPN